MKTATLQSLLAVTGLVGSGLAMAHGTHAEVTGNMLHLLAHNWPLLLGVGAIVAGWGALQRRS